MSIAERDLRRRRASLDVALRDGDIVGAARAWERLRVHAHALTPQERAAGRAARATLGRALRTARYRRLHPAAAEVGTAAVPIPLVPRRSRVRPLALGVAVVTIVGLLIAFFVPQDAAPAPAAAPPQAVALSTPAPTPEPVGGRGRSSALLQPLALPSPPPVAATQPPTPAPATPPPSAAVGPVPTSGAPGGQPGGIPGGVPGGVPSGIPGGVVGGTGNATPRPTPSPSPSLNVLPLRPPPLAVGKDRFEFQVLDSQSLQPLNLVCVVYGSATCGPEDPHTNTLGYYWLDMTPNSSVWNFRFFLDPDYYPAVLNRTARPGMGTVSITIRLRHR
jgi:hypothetical protein